MANFDHSFHPWPDRPVGTDRTIVLTPREIEDAGLLEVLQTPGVAMGTWSILDALLDPGNPKFVFKEPLGRAREVKVSVSGLFGRFVARAYAMRYLGYTHFSHISQPPMRLSGAPWNCVVDRVPGGDGDMPDWVAWSAAKGLAIVEAKGSHDPKGPGAILKRAYKQAERATIRIGTRTPTFKRYAIATRWGFATGPFFEPMIAVHDPEEPGDGVSPQEQAAVEIGIVRLHFASLLRPLGHGALADALESLSGAADDGQTDGARVRAEAALSQSKLMTMDSSAGADIPMIGGFVARSGPIGPDVVIGPVEQETLSRLQLKPTFVGIEQRAINAAIEGDLTGTTSEKSAIIDGDGGDDRVSRRDGSSTWVARLDEGNIKIVRQ